jgi:hypothetical protein
MGLCAAALWLAIGAAPLPAWPLRPSADSRYLIDQAGRPFFIVGDSAQAIYTSLTMAEVADYLADRQARGFNALLGEPIHFDNGRVLPDRNGHMPFLNNVSGGRYDGTLGTADFATPDPAYWDHVDAVLDLARAHGLLVVQYVVSWGYDGVGNWQDLINARNTSAACEAFGRWLGARERDRANILWLDGSDFNGDEQPRAPDQTSGIARALAVLHGMQAAGAVQLRSGDWNADSLATDQPAFAPFMGVNGIYTYGGPTIHSTYVESRRGYLHTPTLPAFLKETEYEVAGQEPSHSAATVRKYEWWSVLSGGTTGLMYGNGDIWPFTPGRWRQALEAPGELDMQRMAGLFATLPWQALVPSELARMRRLVTSENGSQTPPTTSYVAAAQTPDGGLLLAYVPPFATGAQRLSVDLAGMRGVVQARWWDPTSGQATPIGAYPNQGIATFITPGANRSGANDWLLLLQS